MFNSEEQFLKKEPRIVIKAKEQQLAIRMFSPAQHEMARRKRRADKWAAFTAEKSDGDLDLEVSLH
jgi:hypothetical protein